MYNLLVETGAAIHVAGKTARRQVLDKFRQVFKTTSLDKFFRQVRPSDVHEHHHPVVPPPARW